MYVWMVSSRDMRTDRIKQYLGVMKSKDLDNVTFKYYNGVLCKNVVAHYWNVYVWLYLCWSDFLLGHIIVFMILKYALLELHNWAIHYWVVYLIITQYIYIYIMLWIALSSYYNYLTISNHVFWFLLIKLGCQNWHDAPNIC